MAAITAPATSAAMAILPRWDPSRIARRRSVTEHLGRAGVWSAGVRAATQTADQLLFRIWPANVGSFRGDDGLRSPRRSATRRLGTTGFGGRSGLSPDQVEERRTKSRTVAVRATHPGHEVDFNRIAQLADSLQPGRRRADDEDS